ncbi:MAG: ComEA family DNA-binding protein [Eubacteriaceae bacterium]|nr:ComEA family DNA-binding protein [Eubacteriaceae bacterium]
MNAHQKEHIKKIVVVAAIVVIAAAVLAAYYFHQQQQNQKLLTDAEITGETASDSGGEKVVHVAGAVNQPGVYHLKPDARVADAVEAAGGMTEDANADTLNLAKVVEDGEKITIRTQEESSGDGGSGESNGVININSASQEQLMTLPGIGEVLAKNIMDYRTEHGGFSSIEEIKEVNRVGDKLYDQIKDKITI